MLAKFRSPRVWGGLLGLVVVLVVAVVVVTSGGGDDEVGGVPIVIGVSTALTGPSGHRGAEYRDAVVVSVERWKEANGPQILGHDIEVHAEDDGCTAADAAVQAAVRLLDVVGLVGVIGPQCSAGAVRVREIYQDAGIVVISGSATKTDLTTGQSEDGFFFRTAFRNDLEGTLIGQFLVVELGAEEVYMIDDGEAFGIDLADATQIIAEAGGVTVIRESIRVGDVDFSELAAEIAAKAPDFVGFAGFNPEAALLYRQLRDAGYKGLFGAGDGAASLTDFVYPIGEASEGVVFSGCRYPLPDDFLADFADLYGREPEATFPGQYADAVTVLLDAVKLEAKEQDGSLVIDSKALRDAVRASELQGITGTITFDSNGDRVPAPGDELSAVQEAALSAQEDIFAPLGLIPCQVQDGKLVPLGGPSAGEIRLP